MDIQESTVLIIIRELGAALGLKLPLISTLDFNSYDKRQAWIKEVALEIRKRESWSAYPTEWE
jgi:hypothetical protein